MKKIFVVIGVLFIGYGVYKIFRYTTTDKGIVDLLSNNAIILDVRTATEYENGKHIDGSVNISLGSLRERYSELDRDAVYIICCSHGLRSYKAKSILKNKGFKHVYNGGAWA